MVSSKVVSGEMGASPTISTYYSQSHQLTTHFFNALQCGLELTSTGPLPFGRGLSVSTPSRRATS